MDVRTDLCQYFRVLENSSGYQLVLKIKNTMYRQCLKGNALAKSTNSELSVELPVCYIRHLHPAVVLQISSSFNFQSAISFGKSSYKGGLVLLYHTKAGLRFWCKKNIAQGKLKPG